MVQVKPLIGRSACLATAITLLYWESNRVATFLLGVLIGDIIADPSLSTSTPNSLETIRSRAEPLVLILAGGFFGSPPPWSIEMSTWSDLHIKAFSAMWFKAPHPTSIAICAFMTILGCSRSSLTKCILSLRFMTWLGQISFAPYSVRCFTFRHRRNLLDPLVREMVNSSCLMTGPIFALVTLTLADLTTRFIDAPVLTFVVLGKIGPNMFTSGRM